MDKEEKCIVIAEFVDGTQLLYDYSAYENPYVLLFGGKFEANFDSEIDAVQYLLRAGYYKGDERKAVIKK